MWLKWMPFHAAACAAVISLSALAPLRVNADQPSSGTVSPTEPGSVNAQQPSASALSNAGQASGVAGKPVDRHLSRGQYLARTALSYRGLRYRWGGTSSRTGFDCSGLVQAVYAKWGIFLPRVAHLQYKMGTWVKPDKLQPGDLVFFKDTYKRGLSHVGIYIGNGCFLHAAGVHKGVMVSRLDGAYHKKHWAGARRLDLAKLPPVPGEEKEIGRVVLEDNLQTPPDPPAAPTPDSELPPQP